MSIYGYNEEYARKAFYEDGAAAGYAQGKDIGYAKCLIQSVEALKKKLSCSVQEACESVGAVFQCNGYKYLCFSIAF